MRRTAIEVHGRLQLVLHQTDNDSWVGVIEDPRLGDKDDIGALYYVIAVIFIYGLSIVMMIASHIRKNKQDCQLRAYLKEMANLRKADRRDKLMERITALAAATSGKGLLRADGSGGGGGGRGPDGTAASSEGERPAASPARGLFRLASKSSFPLLKRDSGLDLLSGVSGVGGGATGGGGGGGGDGRGKNGSRLSLMSRMSRPCLILGGRGLGLGGSGAVELGGGGGREAATAGIDDSSSRGLDDGLDTGAEDGDFLDLPVEFALDMNRLSPTPTPSGQITPLTSTSATPSPPVRHVLRPLTRITFEDEGFVL